VQLSDAQRANAPTCIIQAMVNDRFLVTARGLSRDAKVDEDSGLLTAGSEVWLQSILTPSVPTLSPDGGPQ
jgi:type IV pilus assembly protein PilX